MLRILIGMILLLVGGTTIGGSNTFTGSCYDFDTYIIGTGVTDEKGEEHPGNLGWMEPNFDSRPRFGRRSSVRASGALVCQDVLVHVRWSAAPVISVLKWNPSPSPCSTCPCKKTNDDYVARVLAHEEVHRQDALDLVAMWNRQHRLYSVTSCAVKGTGLAAAIAENVATVLRNATATLEVAQQDRAAQFHSQPNGQPVTKPGCAPCAPCLPGATPKSCTGCNKCVGELCVLENCNNIGVCCAGSCCGATSNGLWISCCNINGSPACSPEPNGSCPPNSMFREEEVPPEL